MRCGLYGKLPMKRDFISVSTPQAFLEQWEPWIQGGVAASRIHSEIFGSRPSTTPGIAASPPRAPHLPAGSPGTGSLVSFARSGVDVRWDEAFQNLLELAEACDIPVRWSCRSGVCHTCETALVAGAVKYRPDPIDAPADGNALICCCRPQSDIVIDL